MTAQQIADLVKQTADAQLPQVIERLFPLLRNQHAHNACRGECFCTYCTFIRGEYVNAKLRLHKIKKRLRYYEWVITMLT